MKPILLLLAILLMTACERITYAYKFSYKVNTSNGVIYPESYYTTSNQLTEDEEVCLWVELTAEAIEEHPMGFSHKLELTEDAIEPENLKKYHCP